MTRAVVAGGGVAGLAAACRLTELGWTVSVLERRPDLTEGGRAILLQPNGLAALERLGALDRVRAAGRQVGAVSFYVGERRLARLEYRELRHPHPYAVEIRPGALRGALAERLSELGAATPQMGCTVLAPLRRGEAVTGARYRDAQGREQELTGDLLVAADGPGSVVRAGLEIRSRHLGARETYVLGTVEVQTGMREMEIHCGPGYANGVVPLTDGTYFWDRVTSENRAATEARDVAAWRAVFERRVPAGYTLAEALGSWSQLTVVDVRPFWARTRIAPGLALAGGAAGAVHPHAAQGANLALEDAVTLGDGLRDRDGTGTVSTATLEQFARERHRKLRRYVVWSVLAARSYDAPNLLWRPARRMGFACNRIGPVRRALLARGAGLS